MALFDFINNFFNKDIIGISISTKSIIEIVQFNRETKKVVKYGQANIAYDLVTKQISNPGAVTSEISKIFNELDIPFNSGVVISVPSVFINNITLPSTYDEEKIRNELIAETEKNYIFKKNAPSVSWAQITVNTEAETQYLLYSAIKKEEAEKIEGIFIGMGMKLIAIDSSYISLIRGLAISGIVDDDILDGKLWNILVITVNSFIIITLMGDKIIDLSEDPLAIKSFDQNDIYPTIASYSLESISIKNPDHVVIISQTDDVSAEKMTSYFDMDCKLSFIESNNLSQESIFSDDIDLSDKTYKAIGLEAIGSTHWRKSSIPISLNFASNSVTSMADEINFLGMTISLTPQKIVQYFIIGLIILAVIILGSAYLVLLSCNGALDNTLQELNKDLNDKMTPIKAPVVNAKEDPSTILNRSFDNNMIFLDNYKAVGSVIPEKLWIESFSINDDSTVRIKGKALSVDDIINYYQNLSRIGKFKDFKIISVKVLGDSISQADNGAIKISPKADSTPTVSPASASPASPPPSSGLPNLPNVPAISSTPGALNPSNIPSISAVPGSDLLSKRSFSFVFGSQNPLPSNQTVNPPNPPAQPGH